MREVSNIIYLQDNFPRIFNICAYTLTKIAPLNTPILNLILIFPELNFQHT